MIMIEECGAEPGVPLLIEEEGNKINDITIDKFTKYGYDYIVN